MKRALAFLLATALWAAFLAAAEQTIDVDLSAALRQYPADGPVGRGRGRRRNAVPLL